LTLKSWEHAWQSPMASRWLDADAPALGRLAIVWDEFYKAPGDPKLLAEARLQEQRFGLSPLDRSRLEWQVERAESTRPTRPVPKRSVGPDPRAFLTALK
jgi:hypothetical protein